MARREARAHAQAEAERIEAEALKAAEDEARRTRREAERRAAEEAARKQEAAGRKAAAERRAEAARSKAEQAALAARLAEGATGPTQEDTPPPPLTLTHPIIPRRPATARPRPERPKAADAVTPKVPETPPDYWSGLAEFTVDARHLSQNRIVTAERDDPAHAAFDVLRTRLLQALSENGWKRVAITSPTKDCGKTFTAANLAISLSRQQNCRTLLLDCDMRNPSLHKVMGVSSPGSMGDMLRGRIAPQDHLMRLGKNRIHAGTNIAFGFNSVVEPYASELLQDPRTKESLDRIEDMLRPDVILFDLPPALFNDDVIAFRPRFDGLLLVIGGGITTEKEVKEVERRIGEQTPLLGMILNKAEGAEMARYRY